MESFPEKPPHPSKLLENPDILASVDQRLTFDHSSSQWIYEGRQGGQTGEYTYNFILERWIPRENDGGWKRGLDEEEEDVAEEEDNKLAIKRMKKQKMEEMKRQTNNGASGAGNGISETNGSKNTGVFVSGLPHDVTKKELVETFSKYGVLSEDFKTGEARVKLYYDGPKFKNEALVIYHNKESVDLAIQMLDNTFLRGPTKDEGKITVEPAAFDHHSETKRPGKKVLTAEEKKLLNKRKEMMKKKLSTWEDDDESGAGDDNAMQIKRRIWDKIVVIGNMFRIEEFSDDPLLQFDLKEDIQEECDKLGVGNDITKITFHGVAGVVTIKFNKASLSAKCAEAFNGRFFDGLKLKTHLYNGEKFEASTTAE